MIGAKHFRTIRASAAKTPLREKFARTAQWAQGEQSRTAEATEATIQGLLDLNEEHDKKYGFIFIICATGKSAEEMLDALRDSLKNDPETELRRSATEENKITHLRLEKLLSEVS
jgi:2-oxo-4-hydroxy-4-carboxy-5-ureidoimidazoline decarboxylase